MKSVYFGSQNQHFARKIVSTYFCIAFWFCSTHGRRDFGHSRLFSMLFRQNCSPSFPRIQPYDNSTKFEVHMIQTIWYRSISYGMKQVVPATTISWMTSWRQLNTTNHAMTFLVRRHDATGTTSWCHFITGGKYTAPRALLGSFLRCVILVLIWNTCIVIVHNFRRS